jgi:hypothetical protein
MPRERENTRAGGNHTRVSSSWTRTRRPSSGIGTSCGDSALCAALLSYGSRWRAAYAHARRIPYGAIGRSTPSARRGRGCAEQWESRSCARASCHAGRRRTTLAAVLRAACCGAACCLVSRTIGCQTAVPLSRLLRDALHGSVRRTTPHLPSGAGGACRTAPVSDVEGDTLRRTTSAPGLCTTAHCIERSVSRHARPARLRSLHHGALVSLVDAAHASLLLGTRSAPEHARGRAPARGGPARAGGPWADESGVEDRHHEIRYRANAVKVSAGRVARRIRVWKRQIAPPMVA